jgi:hypothetical protein
VRMPSPEHFPGVLWGRRRQLGTRPVTTGPAPARGGRSPATTALSSTTTSSATNTARRLTRSVFAVLVGDCHFNHHLVALSRAQKQCRPGVATHEHAAHRARVLAVRALLLALAGLAAACLAGRRSAARGVSLALSLLAAGYALARRHYPAVRSATVAAATVGAERAAKRYRRVQHSSCDPKGVRQDHSRQALQQVTNRRRGTLVSLVNECSIRPATRRRK